MSDRNEEDVLGQGLSGSGERGMQTRGVVGSLCHLLCLLCLALKCLLLCPALRVFVHLTWLVAWLSCLPCRIWCKIIIIIASPYCFLGAACQWQPAGAAAAAEPDIPYDR
jgi:hypothetical protein